MGGIGKDLGPHQKAILTNRSNSAEKPSLDRALALSPLTNEQAQAERNPANQHPSSRNIRIITQGFYVIFILNSLGIVLSPFDFMKCLRDIASKQAEQPEEWQ